MTHARPRPTAPPAVRELSRRLVATLRYALPLTIGSIILAEMPDGSERTFVVRAGGRTEEVLPLAPAA